MAFPSRRARGPGRGDCLVDGGKHGPNRLSSYLAIHDTIMQQFLGRDFVTSEDLSFSDLGNGVFLMEGTIYGLTDLRISVSKRLHIVGGNSTDPDVCTVAYSYSAILGNRGSIFRYDSPHADHNESFRKTRGQHSAKSCRSCRTGTTSTCSELVSKRCCDACRCGKVQRP